MKPSTAGVCLAAGLSLALAACAPPYVSELDQAAGLTDQMTPVGIVGPVDVDQSATSVRFLPVRPGQSTIDAVDVNAGFVIVDFPGLESLSFISGTEQKGRQTFSLSDARLVAPYPLYEYVVSNTASNKSAIIVMTLAEKSTDGYQPFTVDLSSGNMSPGLITKFQDSNPGELVLGASAVPGSPSRPINLVALTWEPGPTTRMTAATYDPAGGFVRGPRPAAAVTLSSRTLYYYSPAHAANVLSFYSGSRWTAELFDGSPTPIALPAVSHRVDAVLATGEFLSTEAGTLRLYDPFGAAEEIRSIDLQGLQFCYESYVGTDPYVFFVLPVKVHGNQRAFRVYALPSSAMKGLHG